MENSNSCSGSLDGSELSERKASLLYSAFWVCSLILLVDLLSKWAVVHWWTRVGAGAQELLLIDRFLGLSFAITYATNKGAAWGFFAEWQWPLFALRLIIVLLLLAYLAWSPFRQGEDGSRWGWALVATGALANILDTLIYGHVVDLFLFTFGSYRFAIFNVADSAITVGVLLLLFSSLFSKAKPHVH